MLSPSITVTVNPFHISEKDVRRAAALEPLPWNYNVTLFDRVINCLAIPETRPNEVLHSLPDTRAPYSSSKIVQGIRPIYNASLLLTPLSGDSYRIMSILIAHENDIAFSHRAGASLLAIAPPPDP